MSAPAYAIQAAVTNEGNVEREVERHGITYDNRILRALSADVYHYLADICARPIRLPEPGWLGTLAYNAQVAEFCD